MKEESFVRLPEFDVGTKSAFLVPNMWTARHFHFRHVFILVSKHRSIR